MPNVSDIMSTEVHVVQPQESLRQAATLMEELDIGALPVCDGPRLLGMLTDRDITIYGVAQGLDPNSACVSDVMPDSIEYCTANQDTEDVMRQMGDKGVRRLPVIDAERNLLGIVSLGDLALRQPPLSTGRRGRIPSPAVPDQQLICEFPPLWRGGAAAARRAEPHP